MIRVEGGIDRRSSKVIQTPEYKQNPEIEAQRRQIRTAFNGASLRWCKDILTRIEDLETMSGIRTFGSLYDQDIALNNAGVLSPEFREECARYWMLESALEGQSDDPLQPLGESSSGTVKTEFRFTPENPKDLSQQKSFEREEGIDVSGLIEFIERELQDPTLAGMERQLRIQERMILIKHSRQYDAVHKDASDRERKGRNQEEARRIAENPLRATGSAEGDMKKAEGELSKHRELELPKIEQIANGYRRFVIEDPVRFTAEIKGMQRTLLEQFGTAAIPIVLALGILAGILFERLQQRQTVPPPQPTSADTAGIMERHHYALDPRGPNSVKGNFEHELVLEIRRDLAQEEVVSGKPLLPSDPRLIEAIDTYRNSDPTRYTAELQEYRRQIELVNPGRQVVNGDRITAEELNIPTISHVKNEVNKRLLGSNLE